MHTLLCISLEHFACRDWRLEVRGLGLNLAVGEVLEARRLRGLLGGGQEPRAREQMFERLGAGHPSENVRDGLTRSR